MTKKKTSFIKVTGISAAIFTAPFWLLGCDSGGSSGSNDNPPANEEPSDPSQEPSQPPAEEPSEPSFTQSDAVEIAKNIFGTDNAQAESTVKTNIGEYTFDQMVAMQNGTKIGVEYVDLGDDAAENDAVNISDEDKDTFNETPRSPSGMNHISLIQGDDDAETIETQLNALKTELYPNALKNISSADFGNFKLGETVNGALEIAGPYPAEATAELNIYDDQDNYLTKVQLENTNGTFAMPEGESAIDDLAPGNYVAELIVTNSYEGTDADFENASHWRVLEEGNTPPQITGVRVIDEENLKKIEAKIRDINSNLRIAYDGLFDKEDNEIFFHDTDINGFYEVDGQRYPLSIEETAGGQKIITVDISSLGGKTVKAGFEATDYNGAVSVETVERQIDENDAPEYQGGLSDENFVEDTDVIIDAAEFTDPEGDDFTVEQTYGPGEARFRIPGEYTLSATATDDYGAEGESPVFYIEIEEDQNDGGGSGGTDGTF